MYSFSCAVSSTVCEQIVAAMTVMASDRLLACLPIISVGILSQEDLVWCCNCCLLLIHTSCTSLQPIKSWSSMCLIKSTRQAALQALESQLAILHMSPAAACWWSSSPLRPAGRELVQLCLAAEQAASTEVPSTLPQSCLTPPTAPGCPSCSAEGTEAQRCPGGKRAHVSKLH